jgi:hypothetical protein
MNRIDGIAKRDVDVTTYRFGLSTLHAWIRFLECLLHISYRLEIKRWQAPGEDQRKVKNKKKLFKTSSKRKWVFSSIQVSLEGAERQTVGIQQVF